MQFTCTLWRFSSQNEMASRTDGSTSAQLIAPVALRMPQPPRGLPRAPCWLKRGAPPVPASHQCLAHTPRAPGPLLAVGADHGGFRPLAVGTGHGWMARRGGREAAALDPPGHAFLSPPVDGPAQERLGMPPTPNPLITILRDMRNRS
jgi:hypothetical protein